MRQRCPATHRRSHLRHIVAATCDTPSQPPATHRRSHLRHTVAATCDTPSQPPATHRRSHLRHTVAATCDTPSQQAGSKTGRQPAIPPCAGGEPGMQKLRIGRRRHKAVHPAIPILPAGNPAGGVNPGFWHRCGAP
jgi:hypothetical protein